MKHIVNEMENRKYKILSLIVRGVEILLLSLDSSSSSATKGDFSSSCALLFANSTSSEKDSMKRIKVILYWESVFDMAKLT